jgi:hypothetical protein
VLLIRITTRHHPQSVHWGIHAGSLAGRRYGRASVMTGATELITSEWRGYSVSYLNEIRSLIL